MLRLITSVTGQDGAGPNLGRTLAWPLQQRFAGLAGLRRPAGLGRLARAAERGDDGGDGVLQRDVLPQPDDPPAGQLQRRISHPVPFHVAGQLRVPVAPVDRRPGAVIGAGVPETTVHEDRDLPRGERDVGPYLPAAVQVETVVL